MKKTNFWQLSRKLAFTLTGILILVSPIVYKMGLALFIPLVIVAVLALVYAFWLGNKFEEIAENISSDMADKHAENISKNSRIYCGKVYSFSEICDYLIHEKNFLRYYKQMTGKVDSGLVTPGKEFNDFARENVWKFLPKFGGEEVYGGIEYDEIEYTGGTIIYYPDMYKPKTHQTVNEVKSPVPERAGYTIIKK